MKAGRLAVVSLLTDFGTADYLVGAVKRAILSVNPEAVIVDITHEIAPQDISAGAFTLLAAYQTFPAGTVHVAVVDPGVGSTRRAIIVKANEQFFVGPDNGLFTYIYDREPEHRVFHVTEEKYFRRDPSSTFHGRDIFAPVAAALSNGVKPRKFGPRISDAIRLDIPLEPEVLENGDVRGRIINVDHFGNCVTNITRDLVKPNATLVINQKTIGDFRNFYGEDPSDTPFAIWGSASFLEISINGGSAATLLDAHTGTPVRLTSQT